LLRYARNGTFDRTLGGLYVNVKLTTLGGKWETKMDLETLTNGMRERVQGKSGLDATVKFDFGDDGRIFLDGTTSPYTVSNDDKEADCTLSVKMEDFVAIVKREMDPTMAFMMGKLKVAGSMGIAMKLSSVLGG
jgi:putative sterol carrier protein